MAWRGEGGSCGQQKCTRGCCAATWAAICRALADWGEERNPCRYSRWVVRFMEGRAEKRV